MKRYRLLISQRRGGDGFTPLRTLKREYVSYADWKVGEFIRPNTPKVYGLWRVESVEEFELERLGR